MIWRIAHRKTRHNGQLTYATQRSTNCNLEVGMHYKKSFQSSAITGAVLVTGLLAWPAASVAQTAVGGASAVQTSILGLFGGTSTVLADTGTLGDASDARDASLVTGSVPSLLSGEVLSASTIGAPDQVASEASLANLGLTIGGTGISADFVMSEVSALLGALGSGTSLIDNLSINGVPIAVTGQPNQGIWIPGGQVVINEQTVSPGATTVNALHATVFGVADVVIASATAGIQ